MLYWLPWQGQAIVAFAILSTMHPMWVQTALKPLTSPAVGWVTTTLSEVKILPPPTGMSLVAASAVPLPELPPEEPEPDELLPEEPDALLPPPQAATTTATPATPSPARAPRRVVSPMTCGAERESSVTEVTSVIDVSCLFVLVLRSAGRMGLPEPGSGGLCHFGVTFAAAPVSRGGPRQRGTFSHG